MLGALLGGLFGIGSTALQGDMNAEAARKNYEYSRQLNAQQFGYQQELQKQQNDFNLDMWNRENEYNSASAQVQRFQDAGLNVGMMMNGQGAGQAQALTSANPGVPGSAQANFEQPANAGLLADSLMRGFNIDVQKQLQEKSLALQDKKIDIENENTKRDLARKEAEAKSQIDLNKIIGDEHVQAIEESKSRVDKIKQDITNLQKSLDVMDKQIEDYDAKIEQARAAADLARKQGNYVEYNAITNRLNAQAHMITARSSEKLNEIYGEKAQSDIKMTNQQTKNLAEQLKNIQKDGKLTDIEIDYRGKMYKADLDIKNGQVESIRIQNWSADKAKYADVANAYIGVVDNAAKTTSDVMEAVVDVTTYGATTKLKSGQADYWRGQAQRVGMENASQYSSNMYSSANPQIYVNPLGMK